MPGFARISALLIAVLFLSLAAACGTADEDATSTPSGSGGAPTATSAEEQPPLDGTAWLLQAMNGVEMDLQKPITLAFEDGRATGNAGCNDYSGAYTSEPDGTFAITEIIQTDMACDSGMELEAEYLDTLRQAASYKIIEDARLELADESGQTILVFTVDDRLPLDDTAWNVIQIDGEPTIAGTRVEFSLRAGEIRGEGGCNIFSGLYIASDDGSFSTSELMWTERGCTEPEGAMEQEQAFFAALGEIASFNHDPASGTLKLLDDSGQARIIATANNDEADTGIFGSPGWVLETLRGQPVGDDFLATIRFDVSQFAGTAGCIGYNGAFESEPDGSVTRVFVSSSPRTCDDPDAPGDLATDYLAALEEVAQYREAGDGLELLDANGDVLAVYGPAITEHQLEGTVWTLATLGGEPPLPDTTVTIEFSDGQILGSSGCNEYGGPYIVPETGVISIPPAAMTAKACTEPAGVMDQETAFHTALNRARAYQLSESGLELLDANGEVLMSFESNRP